MAEPISDSELAKVRELVFQQDEGSRVISNSPDMGTFSTGVIRLLLDLLDRAEAALPVLIETIRSGCRGRRDPDTGDSLWCLFCECEIASGDAREHEPDCEGIAALRAAGVETNG